MDRADRDRDWHIAIEHLPLGALQLDGDRIVRANGCIARQLRTTPGALRHARLRDWLAGPDAFDSLTDGAPGDGTPVDIALRRADGSLLDARIHACPADDDGGRLLLVQDRSEAGDVRQQLAQQHEELHAMARRLLSVQEEERRILSRELHDDVGQQLTAIKLAALSLQTEDDAQRRAEMLDEIIAITDQTVAKIRNLSLLLRPPQLDSLGLAAALRGQCEVLFRSGSHRLTLDLQPPPQRPAAEVELAAFRIAQESLTNVLRHAQATAVELRLWSDGTRLYLQVRDDGCGFRRNFRGGGLGLATMRERAQQLGGDVTIEAGEECGTCVHAVMPLGR